MWNCLSAIRFRGGLVRQVSCYTLLMRIPTSMATVLLSVPNGTLFRAYRKVGADKVKPLNLRTSGGIPHRQSCLPEMAHYESLMQDCMLYSHKRERERKKNKQWEIFIFRCLWLELSWFHIKQREREIGLESPQTSAIDFVISRERITEANEKKVREESCCIVCVLFQTSSQKENHTVIVG